MTKQSYLTKIRRYRIKKKAVEYFGGKCQKCGWTGNISVLEFHHRDPSTKKFGLSNSTTTNWEKYITEAKKCDLLCSNCHAIIHSDYDDENFLLDVDRYNGRELEQSSVPWKNQTHIPLRYNHKCEHCNSEFESSRKIQKYCSVKCKGECRRKCNRPSREKLKKMVTKIPMTSIGKCFGVTDNSVRKWCKSYGISY